MRRYILAPLKYIAFGMFWALFIMWLFTITVKSDEPVDKPDAGIPITEIEDAPVANQQDFENTQIEAALLAKAHKIENCTVTHYAVCVECCGKTDGITASGRMATPYVSVAVDPGIIPLGADVLVDYGDGEIQYYRADDTGSGVTGNHIDLCVSSYNEAKQLSVQTATVYWIGDDSNA